MVGSHFRVAAKEAICDIKKMEIDIRYLSIKAKKSRIGLQTRY